MNFNDIVILAVFIIALLTGDLMANQKKTEKMRSKSGNCPNVSGQVGICLERCQSDSNCPGKQKCCSNGCGHVCTNPRTRNVALKPGKCPNVRGIKGVCVEKCESDSSCSGKQKCCSNGCGHVCTNPVFQFFS